VWADTAVGPRSEELAALCLLVIPPDMVLIFISDNSSLFLTHLSADPDHGRGTAAASNLVSRLQTFLYVTVIFSE
jgi:hypothetical protein